MLTTIFSSLGNECRLARPSFFAQGRQNLFFVADLQPRAAPAFQPVRQAHFPAAFFLAMNVSLRLSQLSSSVMLFVGNSLRPDRLIFLPGEICRIVFAALLAEALFGRRRTWVRAPVRGCLVALGADQLDAGNLHRHFLRQAGHLACCV